jgi:hydroxymethylpyrimidine pyrophosphatase-like HAD family hydrolase
MKKQLIIGIDFDGTVVEHVYPEVGKPLPQAFEVLKELQNAGHRLVLWTCREGVDLQYAIDFCKENGIEFVSHNVNTKEDAYIWPPSRKILTDVFIDDKNLGGFPGWEVVRKTILG